MRNLGIGIALSVIFVGALIFASRFLSHGPAAAAVSPGYVGSRQFDDWLLVCEPNVMPRKPAAPQASIPLELNPQSPAAAGPEPQLSRCHANIVFARRDEPSRAIAVSFRLVGAKQRLAMIVRFPPLAKRGDTLALRMGATRYLFSVANCPGGACIAMVLVDSRLEGQMVASRAGVLVFPPGLDGRRVAIIVPFKGLDDALTNLRVAQS